MDPAVSFLHKEKIEARIKKDGYLLGIRLFFL
jgi:hypothetical protein